jgi:hypothetical protein
MSARFSTLSPSAVSFPSSFTAAAAESPTGAGADRRQRRSDDAMMALHYQLAFVRHDAEFEAIVLADTAGCLVAGAGAWPTCEMLAAYAPLWLEQQSASHSAASTDAATPLGDPRVEVRTLSIDGMEVLLCGRGGADARKLAGLERAAAGCHRILSASA